MESIYDYLKSIGIERTSCSCKKCRSFCKHMPGYLIPEDLINIISKFITFKNLEVYDYFLASPGATVMKDGRIFNIPTLVPARNEKGYCIFFTEGETCSIHEISPFGCRLFDDHIDSEKADFLRILSLKHLMDLWESDKTHSLIYTSVWGILNKFEKTAKSAEECRKEMVV